MTSLLDFVRCLSELPGGVVLLTEHLTAADVAAFAVEDGYPGTVGQIRTVFPSTSPATLVSFFTGASPEQHGIQGEEVFIIPASIDIRDGRVSRKERRWYRHYLRGGHAVLGLMRGRTALYRLTKRRQLLARRLFRGCNLFIGNNDAPFLYELLGLRPSLCRVSTLASALEQIVAEVRRHPWRQHFVLTHSFYDREEVLPLTARFFKRDWNGVPKVLLGLHGAVPVDYALMFTQGELEHFMRKRLFVALSGRVAMIHGCQSHLADFEQLVTEKFGARIEIRPGRGFAGPTYRSLGLPLRLVLIARGPCVFAYEEVPSSLAWGGDSALEIRVPLALSREAQPYFGHLIEPAFGCTC